VDPEKLLAEDERVVKHLHPHWITMVPAVLWFVAICAAAGAGIAYLPNGSARGPLDIAISAIWVILVSWLCIAPLIVWRTNHYVFTTHRVLIRRGVVRHTGRDISLHRITDVGYTQTLWDRIVKAGTLTIESAGEHGQETLVNVPRSSEVQQMLNRLIEEDNGRRYRQPSFPGRHGYAAPPGYYNQPGYPNPHGYPSQAGFPNQGYPNQQSYPNQHAYPAQGYPGQPGYPQQPYSDPYRRA
jgi:membrane protein YdbS with pleckstrin-like domain